MFLKWLARLIAHGAMFSSLNHGLAQSNVTPNLQRFINECLSERPPEDQVPAPIIEEYCRCYTQRIFDLAKTNRVPLRYSPEYIPFLKNAAAPCVEALKKAMGK
jgi:hypothetical protein